jgi:hypothetical protein
MKFNDVRPSCAVSYVGLSMQEKLQMSEEKNVVRRLQRRGLTDQNRRDSGNARVDDDVTEPPEVVLRMIKRHDVALKLAYMALDTKECV